MKKLLIALLVLAAGALSGAQRLAGDYKSGDYAYDYALAANEDKDGNPFYAVTLEGITYLGSGTNELENATEIDLAGVAKVFAELEAEVNKDREEYVPIRFTGVAVDMAEIWKGGDAVTSISFPGTFEDPVEFFCSMQNMYPNLTEIRISGEGDYTTYDGVVYTADLKELVFCPETKTSVEIPAACTTLPDNAFAYCHRLAKVTGGAGLLYVGQNAFGDTSDEACARGESPVAAPAIPFVRSFPTNSFMMVGKVVFGFRGPVTTPGNSLTFPAGVRALADYAFADPVKYAETIYYMNEKDYDEKTETWKCKLRWVGRNTFAGTIFDQVKGSLGGVIYNHRHGKETKLSGRVDPGLFDGELLALTDEAYVGNTAITNITIPASVEEIGDRCFAECPNLESVTFLGTPKILGSQVFQDCPKLKTVRFEQALLPPDEVADDFYDGAQLDLITYVPGSAAKWPTDEEGKWCGRSLSRSIQVIAQEGVYGKWTLAQLGVTLPKAGTVFTPKAYGLPSGLVLKSNKAVKNKQGKITTKAKTSWWIEGVPLEALDYESRPAYVVVPLKGEAVWQPLQFEVRAMNPEPVLPELQVNETAADFTLSGVGKDWSVSGLPAGLKFATKAVTMRVSQKVKGKTTKVVRTLHKAYTVYGKPTQAGSFIVTAKKKQSNGYYSLKKFQVNVLDESGCLPPDEAPAIISGFDGGDEIKSATVGVVEQFAPIDVSEGTTLVASGLPKGVTLKLVDGQYVFDGVPSAAGTYYITLTATKNGRKVVRRQPIRIEKQPAWVQGSYNGYIGFKDGSGRDPALVTMTVSSAGKVSGKFTTDGKTYTFSRTGLSDLADGEIPEERSCRLRNVVAGYVPVDSKGRKVPSKAETIELGDLVFSDGECGVTVATTADEGLIYWEMQQNRWASDYQAIGKALQQVTHSWTIKNPNNPNNWIKIAFDKKGVVKGTMQVPTGIYTQKKVGKKTVKTEVMYTATCSSVLIPTTPATNGAAAFDGVIRLVFPAGKKKVGKKTFTFEGTTFSETYSNLFSLTLAEDAWEAGLYTVNAEAVVPGLARTTFRYTGTLSVRVGDASTAAKPYIATFKPDGYPPIEFSGKFTPVKKGGEVVYYMARPQITFPIGTTRIIELTILPEESESGGRKGYLDAISFGERYDDDYFISYY